MKRYNFEALFTGKEWLYKGHLIVDGAHIVEIAQGYADNASESFLGKIVPGFIDIQVNGGGGVLLNNAVSVEDIKTIVSAHAKFGTSAMLPTLITDDIDVIERVADLISQSREIKGIIGIHFEGPHLAVPKKGAHSGEKIRAISDREWAIYERTDLGIKHVTLAAECVSDAEIERLVANNVIVSIGHSNASFERAKQALAAGASGFTHLFNAMSPLTGREPGVVGAALMDETAWCGVINDGHHVAYDTLKLALKIKPVGKILLVTDAMSLIGTDEASFNFFDRKVFKEGNKLTSSTGELAGSHLDMISAVLNTVEFLDTSFEEALRMASQYPADFLGLADMGFLGKGSAANWTAIDDKNEVSAVFFAGQKI